MARSSTSTSTMPAVGVLRLVTIVINVMYRFQGPILITYKFLCNITGKCVCADLPDVDKYIQNGT